jgi:hypothetical protein
MSDTKAPRDWAHGIASVIAWVVLIYAVVISSSHIIDTAFKIGLVGGPAWTAPLLVDAVAAIGKIGRLERFKPETRRASLWLFAFGGLMSVTCNVYAGHNWGQRIHGVIVVVVMVWIESHVAKLRSPHAEQATGQVSKVDLDRAVAQAVAEAEVRVRAEQADLVAEAERVTRVAAAKAEARGQANAEVSAARPVTRQARPAQATKRAIVATLDDGPRARAKAYLMAHGLDTPEEVVAEATKAAVRTVRRARGELRDAAPAVA